MLFSQVFLNWTQRTRQLSFASASHQVESSLQLTTGTTHWRTRSTTSYHGVTNASQSTTSFQLVRHQLTLTSYMAICSMNVCKRSVNSSTISSWIISKPDFSMSCSYLQLVTYYAQLCTIIICNCIFCDFYGFKSLHERQVKWTSSCMKNDLTCFRIFYI